MPSSRVLIIDDDPDIAAFTADVARASGFQVAVVDRADTTERILGVCRSFEPEIVVLDLMMPGIDGIQVLQMLVDEACQAEIILFSGADARVLNTTARLAATHGLRIRELLRKPVKVEDLEAALGNSDKPPALRCDDELHAAITKGEITAYFQPKVSLKTLQEWRVEGVEALARWEHPERGLIGPAEFIPVAEQVGLIGELTNVVIDKALRQMEILRMRGHAVDVAVNLSPHILADPRLPDRLAEQLAQHQLEPSQLILEITESAAMADGAAGMGNLARFRLKGMKLSMDDFGTGYSSLVQLHRMPFSELKIDRSFVMEAESDTEARVIVRSTVNLAQSLGLRVCAEGVESPKILAFLRSIGCDQAQGYLISKPLPGKDLLTFLETHAPSNHANVAAVSGSTPSSGSR